VLLLLTSHRLHSTHFSGQPSFPQPRGKRAGHGVNELKTFPWSRHHLPGWVFSRLAFSGLAALAPGDLRAWELPMPSTHLPFVNCRIHRLLGSTFQCCAFSWLLCHLAACRQLCKTARSFLIQCQCQGDWDSVSIFPFSVVVFSFSAQGLSFAHFSLSPPYLSVPYLSS
jgi:hypothetical protein